MAYTGLTPQQRARVGDACSTALGEVAAGPPQDRPAFGSEAFLDLAQACSLLIAELEQRRDAYVVEAALRGAPWQQVGDTLGITRQSASGRWKDAVEAERAVRIAERAERAAAAPAGASA